MSTRPLQQTRAPGAAWPAQTRAGWALDPAEEVALVARARRELLLRAHHHRLRREDLEDCFSQATLELVAQARNGARFSSRRHLANVIEQRFLSRIHDRRRALSGRSPMQAALETALSLGVVGEEEIEIVDMRADPELLTLVREDLRRVQALAARLTPDQRLVIACQVGLQMGRGEFCRRHGWSSEKYRKVAQRGRARLRHLMALEEAGVPLPSRASEEETGTAYDYFSPHS